MSSYTNFDVQFIERTKSILQDYDRITYLNNHVPEKYEVTLFLNCLIGLVVIPSEWYGRRDYESSLLSEQIDNSWGIQNTYIQRTDTYSIIGIVKHIRNAIAHGRIEPFSENMRDITHVEIEDRDRGENLNFEAKIPVDALKIFAIKFADEMLHILNNRAQ